MEPIHGAEVLVRQREPKPKRLQRIGRDHEHKQKHNDQQYQEKVIGRRESILQCAAGVV